MTTQTIDLNLIPGAVLPVVNVSQYDKQARALIFNLFSGEEPFSVPASSSVLINGRKPDKNVFSYPVASYSGPSVVVDVTQQMTAVPGGVVCELRITNGQDEIGSCNFILYVESAPLSDDSVLSDTDIPLIEQAANIAANLNEYIQTTLQASSDAVDAKEQAQTAAESATQSAREAGVYNSNVQGLYNSIEAAKTAANTAAANAQDVADDVQAALDSGALRGPKGDKGDRGDSGVTVPLSGLIAFYINAAGHLIVVTNGNEITADNFRIDESGHLIYTIQEA